MVTTTTDRAEVFSRPAARFDDDGNMEVRASSALGCRRSLWYAATGYEPTNPPSEESLTAMEAGNALEPVLVRAMERAGWKVDAPDPRDPHQVTVRIGPNLLVTGHPDGTVRMSIGEDEAPSQLFLFEGETQGPVYGDPMVVEIKTRGPDAFKRWQTLGAERSHPASVAQAALYSLGEFGDLRDAVIATMDTGARTWDWERIPAQAGEIADASEWPVSLPLTTSGGPDPTRCRSETSPLQAGSAEAASDEEPGTGRGVRKLSWPETLGADAQPTTGVGWPVRRLALDPEVRAEISPRVRQEAPRLKVSDVEPGQEWAGG